MHIVTHFVSDDEPAYGLREGPMPRVMGPKGGEEMRWIQQVFVLRGDAIAKYETDCGPASDFEGIPPLLMPGYGDDPVGLLREIGERHRHDDRWKRYREERLGESTLIKDILRQEEIKLEVMANRSQFGPAVSVERTGFPRQAVARRLKEKKR